MKIFITLLTACFLSGSVHAASLDDDVQRYAQVFADGKSVQTELVESLAWMGISDPRLFDLIERRVRDEAEQSRYDRSKKNEIAYLIRALGFSGQTKYAPVLEQFLSDPVYARYAKNALEDMQNYRKWNPVISNRASFNPKYSDDVNRILNMLRAEDFLLKRIGAKRVYFSNKDAVLLDTLANEIRASYTRDDADSEVIDAIAWMVKALGAAKQAQYAPLLQEVVAQAKNRKIIKYAEQALERSR